VANQTVPSDPVAAEVAVRRIISDDFQDLQETPSKQYTPSE
jgi:hypothetical protein